MRRELAVVPHFMSASTPAILGDLLFVHTSNGVDETGRVPAPRAPSFIAVDRRNGALRWNSDAPGGGLVDGQWSSPTVLEVRGRNQVLFPGGDGWLYSFAPEDGELLWKIDGGAVPDGAKGQRNAFVATATMAEGLVYIAAGRDPEQGSGPGSLWCLDPAAPPSDDPASRVRWRFGSAVPGAPAPTPGGGASDRKGTFARSIATVAVAGGIAYAADIDGFLVALDAATGNELWRHDMLAAVWASPFVAEGRVYISDTDGEVAVLEAGPRRRVLAEIAMDAPIYRSPAAEHGALYLMTASRLYALAEGAGTSAASPPRPSSAAPATRSAAGPASPASGQADLAGAFVGVAKAE
jgi:outer membrane protein assembly factor BamB